MGRGVIRFIYTTLREGGMMKSIGIIGSGRHGSRYANHIVRDMQGMTLGGIARRSEIGNRQAQEWQTRYFADWRRLVNDPAIDAVIGVVPPGINLDIARECARVGKPLLLEKPLARTTAEAAEIVRLLAMSDCPLTVGQTLRYNPVIQALARELTEMGELHSFAVNQRLEPSSLSWHDDPEVAGAGVMIHTAVHVFDALRLITGRRVSRVVASSRSVHSRSLEDLVAVICECDDGVLGTVDVSKVGDARSGRYEFVCRDGHLYGDQIHGFTGRIHQATGGPLQKFAPGPTILALLRDWQAFLEHRGVNPVSGEEGLYAVKVCCACLRSAREGRWVEV